MNSQSDINTASKCALFLACSQFNVPREIGCLCVSFLKNQTVETILKKYKSARSFSWDSKFTTPNNVYCDINNFPTNLDIEVEIALRHSLIIVQQYIKLLAECDITITHVKILFSEFIGIRITLISSDYTCAEQCREQLSKHNIDNDGRFDLIILLKRNDANISVRLANNDQYLFSNFIFTML